MPATCKRSVSYPLETTMSLEASGPCGGPGLAAASTKHSCRQSTLKCPGDSPYFGWPQRLWNWSLRYGSVFVHIQGGNYRSDVWLIGPVELEPDDCADFVQRVKADFATFGAAMAKCRKSLEPWIEFVNPYQRLRRSVTKLAEELKALQLDQFSDLPNILDQEDRESAQNIGRTAPANAAEALVFALGFVQCFR